MHRKIFNMFIQFSFVVRLEGDFCYSANFQNCVYVLKNLGLIFCEYNKKNKIILNNIKNLK